jgi:hypothetical protein
MVCSQDTSSDDADVNGGHRVLTVAREDTGSTKRVWHPGDQHIPGPEKGTTQFERLFTCQETQGSIPVNTIPDISELNQANVALRVLVFAFDPIPVNENTVRGN